MNQTACHNADNGIPEFFVLTRHYYASIADKFIVHGITKPIKVTRFGDN
jgi:hypothetical protein